MVCSYVSTKRENLIKYLKNLQVFDEEKIISNGDIVGIKKYSLDHQIPVEIEQYCDGLTILRISDEKYVPFKGLVSVSSLYDQDSILKGNIMVTPFILEGTDGVGKSSAIEKMIEEGIVCFDRDLDVICRYMLFDVPMEKRICAYKKYLKATKNRIIFLVNNDEEEIRRRIFSRGVISEFDQYAVQYNQMYYDTYQLMKRMDCLYNKLFLLDCTHLSFEEQNRCIKEMVLR